MGAGRAIIAEASSGIVMKLWKIPVFLVLISSAWLIAKYAMVYARHDAAGRRVLADLRNVPLPKDARVLYEDHETGNYFSGVEEATEFLAYRVFIVDLPPGEVPAFFKQVINPQNASGMGNFYLGGPGTSAYLPMASILEHVPESERHHAYILYRVERSDEGGG